MEQHHLEIRVFYPIPEGAELLLRTQLDWDYEIPPTRWDGQDHCMVFELDTDRTFIYFKPVLKIGEEEHYSRGRNFLALTQRERIDVYPHFFEKSRGTITDLVTYQSSQDSERAHQVRVYLPPGYDENICRYYPVLYMHDGHNLFYPEEAFGGQTWEVESVLGQLDRMNLIDPVIVVAIHPQDRMHDYTFPGYEDYGRFIVEDLKKDIDIKFRTLDVPEHTAVMGSSLGGVVSLYMAWHWPEVFGKAACLSSTFAWKDDLMMRITNEDKRKLKIYLDSGWPGDNFEVTRGMFDLLQRQGYALGSELQYFAFPDAEHSESDWATRLHIPFQFLFARYAQDFMTRRMLAAA